MICLLVCPFSMPGMSVGGQVAKDGACRTRGSFIQILALARVKDRHHAEGADRDRPSRAKPQIANFWGGRSVQSVGPFARRTTGGDGDVLAGNRPVPKGHQCHEAFTAQHNMDMFKAAIGRPEGIKPMDQAAAGLAVPA